MVGVNISHSYFHPGGAHITRVKIISHLYVYHESVKGKGKGICLESRYPRYTCSSDFTFPLAVGPYGSLQLSSQTLDLCTRYPLRLGGPRQCGIRSLPDTSTHGQCWESNPRPSDLESNALSTWPHDLFNSEKRPWGIEWKSNFCSFRIVPQRQY